MRNMLTMLAFVGAIAGCASTLPHCDGKDRRPINVPASAQVDYPSCGTTV